MVGNTLWVYTALIFVYNLCSNFQGAFSVCGPELFECQLEGGNLGCISKKWVCDGDKDCIDGKDEQMNCGPLTCQAGKFQCENGQICIPQGWKCDGEEDCIDGSDEKEECQEKYTCPPDQWACASTKLCLPHTSVCDNKTDCSDNSDEGTLCRASACEPSPCDDSTCRPLPSSEPGHEEGIHYACLCPSGYFRNRTLKTCVNLNECRYESYCDQKCRDLPGSYNCSCHHGYKLTDSHHCTAINDPVEEPAYLLYANSEGIQMINLDGTPRDPPIKYNTGLVTAMDHNFSNKTICYVLDSSSSEDQRGVLDCVNYEDGSNWTVSLTYDLRGINGMAWDWVNNNWYFSDKEHDRIFICSVHNHSCITLLSTALNGLKSIAVDPISGYLFFTVFGHSPKIERTRLDGSMRHQFVVDHRVVQPQALAVDIVNRHLYWADAYLDRLERVPYEDGNKRTLVIFKHWVENIFGVGVLESSVYLTSQRNHSVYRLHRFDNAKTPRQKLVNGTTNPTFIRVVHKQAQPDLQAWVQRDKKVCEHVGILLLQQNGSYITKCLCRAGFKLSEGTKCISGRESRFLIYSSAKEGQVKGISINPHHYTEVIEPIDGLGRPVAVDFDSTEEFIYYSDAKRFKIGRRKVDGSERNDSFIDTGIKNCEGIAIDWIGRNIFWTDETQKTISVAKIEDPSIRKTLISNDTFHPRAIVVNPRAGLMYWSDWVQRLGPGAKIEQANMDGTDRASLIDDSKVLWPNGLSIDYKSDVLYWCDAYFDKLEMVDLKCMRQGNGSCRHMVMISSAVDHPYGLVHVWNDDILSLYWTEFSDGQIKYIQDISHPNVSLTIKQDSVPIFEIRLYDPMTQKPGGCCAGLRNSKKDSVDYVINVNTVIQSAGGCAVNNGGCPELCLATAHGVSCVCQDGRMLDNKTCIADPNYPELQGCKEGMFACSNGRCINKRWLCDGDNDCGDNSDELSHPATENSTAGPCLNHTCQNPEVMYKCSNNRCIYQQWMCDGENDCRNGEDEKKENCQNSDCAQNMTRCRQSQRCIPISWHCDHDYDCNDGSDEAGCSNDTCRINQFMCTSNNRCISREYVCDGDNDCRDGSDELNCGTCNNMTHFQCGGEDGECIRRELRCDGEDNCPDGDDELNCTALERDHSHCSLDNQFRCKNGLCIFHHLKCDGDDDCGDGSDEKTCPPDRPCPGETYKCPNESRCIPNRWKCDGENDCGDNSDESNCPPDVECEAPNWHCNYTRKCLPVTAYCNNELDCPDARDEGGLCAINECQLTSCSHFCANTPTGPLCYCPAGKRLSSDNITCVELNPCDWGTCSQGCINVTGSYLCACNAGYTLAADRFTCKPNDNLPTYIIFSNRHEIRRLDVERRSYVSLVSGLRNAIALDYYYKKSNKSTDAGEGSLVFWTDVVDDKIYRGTVISNSVSDLQPIISMGLATTEGLAVDWVARKIYWVESKLDQIEVANFDGSKRATLIAGQMASPRAIVVDPRRGLLFWSDWESDHPRIERCSMAGEKSERRVIFNVSTIVGAGWPNGLTADYEDDRLYWIDARSDSIHSITYDGTDHREILRGHEHLSHPFAISLFGNYVYWTDWRTNSLLQANKWNGSNATVIQTTITQPFDLQIFHPLRQPEPTHANPCAENNGGCGKDALCLLTTHGQRRCHCPHLMKPTANEKDCELDGNFLLFTKRKEIRGVHLMNANHNIIPALTVPNVHSPQAIDYDVKSHKLYWTDGDNRLQGGTHNIARAYLNSSDVEVLIDTGTPNPKGFAIDWISGNMYFSSYDDKGGKISVAKLSGIYRTVLVQDGINGVILKQPSSLALHPIKGRLYWSDNGEGLNDTGSVWMANLDGTGAQKLFPQEDPERDVEIAGPLSLTIDYKENKLWWVNSRGTNTHIAHCDLDGNHAQAFTLKDTSVHVVRASAISVHDKIFIAFSNHGTPEAKQVIGVIDKNGTNYQKLRDNTPAVTSLKVFITQRLNDKVTNDCARGNGGCEQLCIPLDGKRVCRCTEGYKLVNATSCSGVPSFLMYSTRTQILGLPISPNTNNTKVLAAISKINMASALDFHAANDYIYWVDTHNHSISRIKRDLTMREVIIDSGIGGVDGIAVDWIANNIYWTDYMTSTIEVARTNGSNHKVVIGGDMGKPRNIVVDPVNGFMYWSDWGINPRIERAKLDGSDREVFINTSIQAAYGLDIDYDRQYLVWCDQRLNKMETVNLKTRERKVILRNLTDCVSLSLLGDQVYFADLYYPMINGAPSTLRNGAIMRVSTNGSNQQVIRDNLGGYVSNVKIYHKEKQKGTNLCKENNGGCEELCFYVGESQVRCSCAHGRVVNRTQCADYEDFIAFSGGSGIETVHAISEFNHNAPRPRISDPKHMRNVIGLTFDYDTQRYFFTDIQRGDIQSVKFDGSDIKVVVDKVGSAEGLAYDSLNQILYWTSYTNSSISCIKMDGKKNTRKKLVQLLAEDHPRAIDIDPCAGLIFWTNWNSQAPTIQKSDLDGKNPHNVFNTRISTPNALVLDQKAKKLYWSDARLDKIERCDYNGENRVVIAVSTMGNIVLPEHAFSLAIYQDYIYCTDWIHRGVIRLNKYTGADGMFLIRNIPRQPMGIVAISKNTQNCNQHPCSTNNGGCEQTCETNAAADVICGCNAGYVINSDNVTCKASCGAGEFGCANITECISASLACDGFPHCVDASDEDSVMCKARKCAADYFACGDGQCIPKAKQCNKVVNCKNGADEQQCSCGQDEFQCVSNKACIKLKYRCDFDFDCQDASDEMNCTNITDCSHSEKESRLNRKKLVKCNTTTACIQPSWICDKQNDCGDWSDEQNCPSVQPTPTLCRDDWMPCNNTNECIPAHWFCDKDTDCPDGSDEHGCQYTCSPAEKSCDLGTMCIPQDWFCDGHIDCEDRSDESNCKSHTCYENEFPCNQTGNCIPKTWVCDGEDDCTNGEDEHPDNGCVHAVCNDQEYMCRNWRCINKAFYCDRDDDCGDNSDEPESCNYQTCGSDTFQCGETYQCIPLYQKCDGSVDCEDGSDEGNATCGVRRVSACGDTSQWECGNGVCISEDLLCNQQDDCGDSSDETSCNVNECELDSSLCLNGKCHDLKVGFQCVCDKGYQLLNDSRSCTDINECETKLVCSHFCFNHLGSFRCSCAEGFQLGADKRSCKVIETEDIPRPYLLISNRYYIRNITLTGSNMELLARNLTNAVALDFDWQDRSVYWSDVTSSASRIMRMDIRNKIREVLHSTTLRNPDGIAVDWVGRNLYWCDKTTDTIEVSTLDGKYRRILLKTGIQEPRAIAVHPYAGYLYYSDWGDEAHIGRMGMDGSSPKRVVTDHVSWPNALTIDYVTGHIYWADARLDYIALADLDGNNRHYVLQGRLPHIFAIVVFEDYVYWTDWEYKTVERANKYTGMSRSNVTTFIHRPMDIQIFHPYRQNISNFKKMRNPCSAKPCGDGTLCLIKPGGRDRVCACPEHHYPSQNKTMCIANCTSSEYLCEKTHKCIPSWWRCDTQDDCGEGSDEPEDCPPYFCRQTGLYQCRGATSHYHCISPTQICDGVQQCLNGSDEEHCDNHTCLETQFKCSNESKCIPLSHKCNGNPDCANGSDEKDCPTQSCAQHQFQCDNGRCIPYVWRCDHDNDCGDNSDEPATCRNSTCRTGYLKCKESGRCVPQSWKCDGDPDCGANDHSDEPKDECDSATCDSTYFKCANNRCIPGRWQCDYDDDCQDGSDEVGCTLRNCSESEFRCGTDRCIQRKFVCDGQRHCVDNSDEKDCTNLQPCEPADKHFRCRTTDYCLPHSWKCDGELDCDDHSDEENCTTKCHNDEFQCHNSLCIPQTWRCDGQQDCFDSSDEKSCRMHTCAPGYFQCSDYKCIPSSHVCDSVVHCSNATDEAYCGMKTCPTSAFRCGTGQCLDLHYVCDNYPDCADGSDEGEVCRVWETCNTDSDCRIKDMTCQDADNGTMRCVCKPGLEYHSHTNQCEDKDECKEFGICAQICVNERPGYKCLCGEGYYGLHRNETCKPINVTVPYILIGAENQIHKSELDPHGFYNRLYPQNTDRLSVYLRITSMAVDVAGRAVYMSSVGTSHTSISKFTIPKDKDKDQHSNTNISPRLRRDATNEDNEDRKEDNSETGNSPSEDSSTDQQAPPGLDTLDIPDLKEPVAMAWDWVGQHLYWIDAENKQIMMMNPKTSNIRAIHSTNIDQPSALAVDPKSGQLFWTDRGRNPRIESSWLDGSNRKVIIDKDIMWPGGIAIDYPSRRLYWTDIKKGNIETIPIEDPEPQRYRVTKQSWKWTLTQGLPFRIAVFEDYIYVTTYRTHTIRKVARIKDEKPIILARGLLRIRDIVMVHPSIQDADLLTDVRVNRCGNVSVCDGSMMCVNIPESPYYRCVCPHGQQADPSTGRCVEKDKDVIGECNGLCYHNASCRQTESGSSKCHCQPGYDGGRCQQDLCYAWCKAGGTCIRGHKNATCQCPLGYSGPRCETYKCSGYCQNGGHCKIDKATGEPLCICNYNFKGDRCTESRSNKCDTFTCYNKGVCTSKNGRPICQCQNSFTGPQCETCTTCSGSSSCTNFTCTQGYCVRDVGRNPTCQCKDGYVSQCDVAGGEVEHCEEHCVDPCQDYCQNGARCTIENKKPVCKCTQGFSGQRCNCTGDSCEGKVQCQPDSCMNGATCHPGIGKPQCLCALGYTGTSCHLEVGCSNFRCQNGGSCHQLGKIYKCKCTPEYFGRLCKSKNTEACMAHCKNGEQCTNCDMDGSMPVCLSCEKPVDAGDYSGGKDKDGSGYSSDKNTLIAIILPAILCVIIVLVILGICLYRRRASRQFKHMRMTDSANVEITNPMYMRDYEDDEGGDVTDAYTLDPDKNIAQPEAPTNFSNPMYDTLYNENAAGLVSPDGEKNQLLKEDNVKVRFYGDEERQPLEQSNA